jgi:hypothetical protein
MLIFVAFASAEGLCRAVLRCSAGHFGKCGPQEYVHHGTTENIAPSAKKVLQLFWATKAEAQPLFPQAVPQA